MIEIILFISEILKNSELISESTIHTKPIKKIKDLFIMYLEFFSFIKNKIAAIMPKIII